MSMEIRYSNWDISNSVMDRNLAIEEGTECIEEYPNPETEHIDFQPMRAPEIGDLVEWVLGAAADAIPDCEILKTDEGGAEVDDNWRDNPATAKFAAALKEWLQSVANLDRAAWVDAQGFATLRVWHDRWEFVTDAEGQEGQP